MRSLLSDSLPNDDRPVLLLASSARLGLESWCRQASYKNKFWLYLPLPAFTWLDQPRPGPQCEADAWSRPTFAWPSAWWPSARTVAAQNLGSFSAPKWHSCFINHFACVTSGFRIWVRLVIFIFGDSPQCEADVRLAVRKDRLVREFQCPVMATLRAPPTRVVVVFALRKPAPRPAAQPASPKIGNRQSAIVLSSSSPPSITELRKKRA